MSNRHHASDNGPDMMYSFSEAGSSSPPAMAHPPHPSFCNGQSVCVRRFHQYPSPHSSETWEEGLVTGGKMINLSGTMAYAYQVQLQNRTEWFSPHLHEIVAVPKPSFRNDIFDDPLLPPPVSVAAPPPIHSHVPHPHPKNLFEVGQPVFARYQTQSAGQTFSAWTSARIYSRRLDSRSSTWLYTVQWKGGNTSDLSSGILPYTPEARETLETTGEIIY
ncbi:hypothetical protein BOTBODRAFT_25863 [Botryobasidium botryosum FD-172 SS1]|uniref:Uncharacterized protein n=1 Tax=Botryobasidium botryosum (strain FD-172 SS1) TaxID=930990 RepID=A0A067N0A9_BOTB1|nr:hypothetical protein BOTBODRAFT_25863 [Botryobasidium botryosum FD-172 SS1]